MRLLASMQARTYALALSAIALGLFLAVAAANFVIDPTGVFGNSRVPGPAFNERYARFSEYQSHADRYDAAVFGSSRLQRGVPLDELSRHLGGAVADFGVRGGSLSDFVPVLEYMVRNPPPGGMRIRDIFLLLDADLFGWGHFTNQSLAFALPWALTGESRAHFWWRNLVAVQPRFWRDTLRVDLSRVISMSSIAANAQGLPQPKISGDRPAAPEKITERLLYLDELQLWRKFADLCRQHDIRLIVALGPLSRESASAFDRADLAKLVDDVARVAPVWDFTEAGWVADDPSLWADWGHFNPEVGRMIIARVFGEPMPPQWASFGHFYPQRRVVTHAP
jgi:hypothetical protein